MRVAFVEPTGGSGHSRHRGEEMKHLLRVAVVCCCLMAPLSATVLVPADVAELTHDANVIARGAVVAVDSQWADGRRGIETIVTIEAEAFLKGQLAHTVQFRVPGGTLGRYRNIVMGAPSPVTSLMVMFRNTGGFSFAAFF